MWSSCRRVALVVVVHVGCGRIGFAPVPELTGDGDVATHDSAVDAFVFPPFGPATPVTELNSATQDMDPTLASDGLELVFSSDRPGALGSHDVWVATRGM